MKGIENYKPHEQAVIFMLKSRLSMILSQIEQQPLTSTLRSIGRAYMDAEQVINPTLELEEGAQ